ncbi:WRKY transcription factor SUSIBA2-like [Macadamia integrifolia]|uniref:WRKY transcription factor SUSIBA2-like n=1 Tax=Macadamia integrifolia TaxID=60698 RepID=UPI001C4EFBB0|nr:WRKY transcription factor SUSIBA2-like [Macadamia integrifolia]
MGIYSVMAETEENFGVDWRSLVSSPKGIFSALISEGFPSRSLPQILTGSDAAAAMVPADDEKAGDAPVSSDSKAEEGRVSTSMDGKIEVSGDWKPNPVRNGASIAERRAATCGFSAPRINTPRFRSISPLTSPGSRSPYLTIPPGLSPTSLLDSPIMLPNSQAQPSPTTGTFSLPLSNENPMSVPLTSGIDKEKGDEVDSSFMFKPDANPGGLSCLLGSENQVASSSNQAQNLEMTGVNRPIPAIQPNMNFECQNGFLKQAMTKSYSTDSPSDIEVSNSMTVNSNCVTTQTSNSNVASDQAPLQEEPLHGDDTGSQQILEGEQKGAYPSMGMGKPSEDGYNWRKYGQKQVKGSEYPRSYYKCTHPNCQVKKKVERSLDGQITEIIYKGAHNHPKPQPSRRSAVGSSFSLNELSDTGEGPGTCVKVEGGSIWKSISQGPKDHKVGSEWRADGLERTSSTSILTELSDPLSTVQGKHLGMIESADTPELSSTLVSHEDDDDDDIATQGSISVGDDGDDEESESKRRKKESCLIEANLASRAVREPRVVVQTDSEVDILDDGYRWRKYGQKVVKGNPNPRSYYKCTSAGCPVRKHVERASHDLKSVITTYEGKHNHEVPTARNSSHASPSSGNVSQAGPNAQTTLTLPVGTNFPKTEPQVQDLAPRFERKPEFTNEFLRPGYLGGFHGDIKLSASACYEMKLPPMSFGSFGLNASRNESNQVASIAQVVPEFPITMPMNMHRPGNLPLTSFGFNNHGRPIGPVQSYLGMRQPKETDTRFLRPKEEQKDDAVYDTCLPMSNLANTSTSVYRQMMGGFPL